MPLKMPAGVNAPLASLTPGSPGLLPALATARTLPPVAVPLTDWPPGALLELVARIALACDVVGGVASACSAIIMRRELDGNRERDQR